MVFYGILDVAMQTDLSLRFSASSLPALVSKIAFENWLRYALVAGLAWVLAYHVFKKRCWPRKIVMHTPSSADVRRELKWSLLTALVYGMVGAVTIIIARSYGSQMYRRLEDHGWGWFVVSIGIAIIVHDTWFYWTHRLMHRPRLFRLFHRVHHESTNPSRWAAYAFGPLEAVVQACIFPLLLFTVPMHPLAIFAFMIWQIFFNVIGHTGFEYHPRWFLNSWLGKVLNTPTNHVLHHEKLRGNYGLYFNVWDRLMGTNHPDYAARFEEVTTRSMTRHEN